MSIPFVDLQSEHQSVRGELDRALSEVLRTSSFVLGAAVEDFEEDFAAFCGTASCAGVSSGTAALHLALRAHDVGEGDEVLTTPFTFIATAWAISYVGATPVFVDIDPETYTLDPTLLEDAITERTKAVVPVHLYGHPADMAPILEVAGRHDLAVIEDACQAHGAMYREASCGSIGDTGCFSFYPSKNLGACGEAGAVVTSDPAVDARVRRLRDHAQGEKNVHEELGFNYRMDGLQGAALGVKLDRLEGWNRDRRRVAARYREALEPVDELRLPGEASEARHVYHLYVVRLPTREVRDGLRRHLEDLGVSTGIHYPTPVHRQRAYKHLDLGPGSFPRAEGAAERVLSLPMFPHMTDNQVREVARGVRDYFVGS